MYARTLQADAMMSQSEYDNGIDRRTDGHHTITLHFLLDAASIRRKILDKSSPSGRQKLS